MTVGGARWSDRAGQGTQDDVWGGGAHWADRAG